MAAFSVAPAVSYSERDATLYTKSNVVVKNAIVGIFDWGPIELGVDMDGGKEELLNTFGKPTVNNYLDHFIAIDYLRYSRALAVMRVEGDAALNASSEGYGPNVLVKNVNVFKANAGLIKDGTHFMARYAGSLGNNLMVSVADSTRFPNWEFNNNFTYAPEAGEYAVAVVDTSGSITGFQGAYGARVNYTLRGRAESSDNITYRGYGDVAFLAGTTAQEVAAAQVAGLPSSAGASYRQSVTGQNQKETIVFSAVTTTDASITNSSGSAAALSFEIDGISTPVNATIGDGATKTLDTLMQELVDSLNSNYDWAEATLTTDETANTFTLEYNRDGNFNYTVLEAVYSAGEAVLSPFVTLGVATITQTAIEDEFIVSYTETAGVVEADGFVTLPTSESQLVIASTAITSQGSSGDVITGEAYELMQLTVGAKKDDGSSAYFPTIVNEGSKWIYFAGNTLENGDYPLSGGANDHADASRYDGYDAFSDASKYKIKGIVDSCTSLRDSQQIVDVCVARRDCVGIIGVPLDTIQNHIGGEKEAIVQHYSNLARSTSYQFNVDNWARVYDEYNDRYVWIPCTGGVAGKRAYNMQNVGAWKSFSYYNRGLFSNWESLAWSASDEQRGDLYNASINSIIFDSSDGFVLMGTKTGLKRPSKFSRITVRDLFIMCEQDIQSSAKYFLGEDNDDYTQRLFRNTIRPYMRNLRDQRALTDFMIKADDDNNTSQVKSNNQFIAGIWIKPKDVIDWIWLDFAAVGEEMSFEEVEGAAGIAM